MWNINNIKTQQKYITERLSNCTNQEEREKLQLSLVSYSALLDNSGTLIHTQIPNVMDRITNNQYSNKREKEMAELEKSLFYGDEAYIDDNYLSFLIQLCDNVSSTNIIDIDEASFKIINVTYESMIAISKQFYSQLGDKEIYDNALRILEDESALNLSKVPRRGMTDCSGLTLNDYIFNKSYCNVTKQNNVFDYQILNHEIMHGVDFYMKKKTPSQNYYGFHEVPTYTIDYLFIDFLESSGLYPDQVQSLKQQKDNYLQSLATITKMKIKRMVASENGYKASINPSIENIKQIINPQLKKQLLEIQSGIMAFGLYQQINQTGEIGIENLKKFMKTIIPKEETPNFDNIGLTNESLLECSLMIGTYSKSNEQIGKMK